MRIHVHVMQRDCFGAQLEHVYVQEIINGMQQHRTVHVVQVNFGQVLNVKVMVHMVILVVQQCRV